jgi:hypothetical protein
VRGYILLISGFGELVFTGSAERANPIIGKVLKRCSGSDAAVGIAYCGIVLVSAQVTYVLTHNH